MKKWSMAAGAIMLALLLGTLVLLGCYFFSDLSAAFSGQTTAVTTTVVTIQTTQTETTGETTLPEETTQPEETTLPEETTIPVETTVPVVTTKPTEPPPTTKPTQPPTTKPTEPATEPTEATVTAQHAFVYDTATGEYLYKKGESSEKVFPASITKLFTAYVALQHLDPATVITAGDEINSKLTDNSSRAWIQKGHRLTVEMCVEGMLLPSGNDAAYVLAVAAGRAIRGDSSLSVDGALDAFMEEMNRQAQALGMTGTHFVNPDGIHHTNHYTTPDDLVIIAKLSMSNGVITKYAAKQKDTVTFASGQIANWTNSNKLLDPSSKYYSADAIGLKTGSTQAAGSCLLAAFRKGDKLVFVCVIGSTSDTNRYKDTLALYKAYG